MTQLEVFDPVDVLLDRCVRRECRSPLGSVRRRSRVLTTQIVRMARYNLAQEPSATVANAGDHVDVYFNGTKLIDVHDSRFSTPGKAGLWTKAESHTLFDDLTATVLTP